MNENDFKLRTQDLAIRTVRLIESLPRTKTAEILGTQLLRSGTSVGANYRAACRAKSKADLISKLAIVEEEADECIYWIDLLVATGIVRAGLVDPLKRDFDQIVAMTVASIKTLKFKTNPKSKIPNPKSI